MASLTGADHRPQPLQVEGTTAIRRHSNQHPLLVGRRRPEQQPDCEVDRRVIVHHGARHALAVSRCLCRCFRALLLVF